MTVWGVSFGSGCRCGCRCLGAYVHPSVVKRAAQATELYGNDGRPYSETSYDGSELGRVVKQAGVGNDWHAAGKAVTTDYVTNAGDVAQLSVRMYGYSGNGLKSTGYYADGSLYGVKVTEEDGNVSYEFKDKLGRVVLNRQMDGSLAHDTYYVYDEYGNVRFVLPPLAADNLNSAASWTESNEILKKYVYVYRYDKRTVVSIRSYRVVNRCIRFMMLRTGLSLPRMGSSALKGNGRSHPRVLLTVLC